MYVGLYHTLCHQCSVRSREDFEDFEGFEGGPLNVLYVMILHGTAG